MKIVGTIKICREISGRLELSGMVRAVGVVKFVAVVESSKEYAFVES